eukprot:gnl/Hemi2/12942_TR4425_c0_g1_i1.p1 gnl/Hemi2/12942_TR4425_c0_g1~~gnl/Hemi2/12942_TR4425_c0_g1_i1.p1  ORF type:complete len:337 (-),score=96.53 gnl/Hemi2/12942_TR4425_c0_g1_i1:140-1150(-)
MTHDSPATEHPPHAKRPRLSLAELFDVRLAFAAAGIWISFVLFGIEQEAIQKTKHGEAEERFHHFGFSVFVMCCVNVVFGLLALLFTAKPQHNTSDMIRPFWKCGSSYVLAMVCSSTALDYIDFPTQVLVKCCKAIPVMFGKVILTKKTYSFAEYLCVLFLSAGIGVFTWKANVVLHIDPNVYYFGLALAATSLLLDGYTNASQDELVKQHSPNAFQLVVLMNFWGTLVMFFVLLLKGELLPGAAFCLQYPLVIGQILLCAVCMAVGQIFLMYTVTIFGTLTMTKITTIRKCITVLTSVVVYNNPFTNQMWLGTLLVFCGLFLEVYVKQAAPPKHH